MTKNFNQYKHVIFITIILCLIALKSHGKVLKWQDIAVTYPDKTWSILTSQTIKKVKILHLHQSQHDGYPISIFMGFIPKKSRLAKYFTVTKGRSANIIGVNFSWPVIKRFAGDVVLTERLISFNEIEVSKRLTPGALLMLPTPQSHIFVSAQTFYLDSKDFYIIGTVITRVDKGTVRRSQAYSDRIDSAYQLLANIKTSQ